MTSTDQTEWTYRWLSLGLLLVSLGIAFATIGDYGMGWDEVTRWDSGDAKVAYFEKLLNSSEPLAVMKGAPRDSYPGLFDMTLSLLHRLTGWDRFMLGHWQAFIFGLIGLLSLWRIGQIFGGARLAFWSALLLLLTPVFFGHWFHNPKDIPFAATYTLGLLALIEWLRRFPRLKKRWLLVAGVACGLCMSTQIAGMVLLAYAAVGVGVIGLIHLWALRSDCSEGGEKKWAASLRSIAAWALSWVLLALLAYLTLLLWWPAAHRGCISESGATLERLHVSASKIPLFFRGEVMLAADAPNYYTLWMFGLKAPELLLLGLILGLPMAYLWARERIKASDPPDGLAAPTILLLGALFPLVYLTYSGPALHNGARHFLFAFPPLCLCAAWGYLRFWDWLRAERPGMLRAARLALGGLVLVSLVYLIKLHPYQYVYFNALSGGVPAAFERYEGEYWFTSSKHALEQLEHYLAEHSEALPSGRPVQILILGPWQVVEPFLPEGFQLTHDRDQADFFILNTQMGVHRAFSGQELFRIERLGAPICIVYASNPES